MIFNFLVLISILLLAGYCANQGLLSAVITFVTATFASILSMALFEPLGSVLTGYKPAYARGMTFLVLFLVIFAVLRLATDFVVPKDIKLAKFINSIGGGVIGFFAALVIVGTSVIGIEMLPIYTTVIGFERYPGESGMQGTEQGTVAPMASLFFWPDRFTLALWNGVSGRALGGGRSFGVIHPDLTVESYGYRNVVEFGSNPVLLQELLAVPKAYATDAAAELKKYNIPADSGKQAAVVRIEVKRDGEGGATSADSDTNFRISASEIRLVTAKGQHYPIGHLENGTKFEAMSLQTGHLVDDYVGGKVIEDWVFQIEKEEKPELMMLEVKQLARVDVTGLVVAAKGKAFAPLAASMYPQRSYRWNGGTIVISVAGEAGPVAQTKVMLLPAKVPFKNVQTALIDANRRVEDVVKQLEEGTERWNAAVGKPGVPAKEIFFMAKRKLVELMNTADTEVMWLDVIPTLLVGASESNGADNLAGMPRVFGDKIEKLFGDIRASGTTGANGEAVTLTNVAPGSYCVVAATKTLGGYYVWAQSLSVSPKSQMNVALNPQNTVYFLAVPK